VILSPLIQIQTLATDIDLDLYQWLIFTSANGVLALRDHGLSGRMAICVGPQTMEAARQAGMTGTSVDGTSADMIATVTTDRAAGSLLHVRGVHGHGDVAANLRRAGINADEVVVYDQTLQDLSQDARDAVAAGTNLIAPIYSKRTGTALRDRLVTIPATVSIVAISEPVAELFSGFDCNVSVADFPNGQSMRDAVAALFPSESAC
jgi:uroporphyrinogen-III synthase